MKDAPAGMIPADVAGYPTTDGDRYAVLWRKPGTGEQAVAYAGVSEPKHKPITDAFKKDGYLPATVQALVTAHGTVRLQRRLVEGAGDAGADECHWISPLLRWSDAESTHDDFVFSGEHVLLDVHLGPRDRHRPARWPGWLAWPPHRAPFRAGPILTLSRVAITLGGATGTTPASGATTRSAKPPVCTACPPRPTWRVAGN